MSSTTSRIWGVTLAVFLIYAIWPFMESGLRSLICVSTDGRPILQVGEYDAVYHGDWRPE